jgi:hypothetical protein
VSSIVPLLFLSTSDARSRPSIPPTACASSHQAKLLHWRPEHLSISGVSESDSFSTPPTSRPAAVLRHSGGVDQLPPAVASQKPRRIWEEEDSRLPPNPDMRDFSTGLICAGNAQIIKGDRAQACIPPLLTLFQTEQPCPSQPSQELEEDADDDIGSSNLDYDIESQWSGGTSRSEDVTEMDIEAPSAHHPLPVGGDAAYPGIPFPQFPQRHPLFDDSYSPTPDGGGASPEPTADEDPASSPLGPITPFGVFVDRAVAASQYSGGPEVVHPTLPPPATFGPQSPYGIQYGTQLLASTLQYETAGQRSETAMPPAQDVIPMPSATHSYKKVADPLAEWVAAYVWKVCTTGMSLNTQYTYVCLASVSLYIPHILHRGGSFHQYPPLPPAYLANSIRSLLLSTLLQPSAVLLAVWYIVRLPVRFGRVSLRPDAMKEVRFRLELGLGEWQDSGSAEAQAPFRLVLLGCMLANKWLDDHTFSNKTWYACLFPPPVLAHS